MDTLSVLSDIFGKDISKLSKSEVSTPINIVKDMVSLLPDDIFVSTSTFLDPAVKSGRFLVEIYDRLMDDKNEAMKAAFPDEASRKEHILTKQLFGIATSSMAAAVARRSLYGTALNLGNIIYSEGYEKTVIRDKSAFESLLLGAFNIMKFDVVIGNPPYNDGTDLDFIHQGFLLSTKYTVMVTPAKWQTAEANQKISSKTINYGKFRELLVPHMSTVVFYPDCKDVFDSAIITDGITYFMLDKEVNQTTKVENRCSLMPILNSITFRNILHRESLINLGNEINQYLKDIPKYSFGSISYKSLFFYVFPPQILYKRLDAVNKYSNRNI